MTEKVKAQDLRVGNWIIKTNYQISSRYQKITTEFIQQILNGDNRFDGIPLTPEILLKCGFEETDDSYGGYLISVSGKARMRVMWDGVMFYFDAGIIYVSLRYLHQLQNLFYSLTNKELEIRL